jgi:GDP-D-mannose dehydratase
LLGDAGKAKAKLSWEPKYSIMGLVEDMIEADSKEFFKRKLNNE